ncbi:hypothetical protein CUMW_012100 [Citrus unshiu]|nr:hypothetical protein CUMW_012100 [Citrus unshiu]
MVPELLMWTDTELAWPNKKRYCCLEPVVHCRKGCRIVIIILRNSHFECPFAFKATPINGRPS